MITSRNLLEEYLALFRNGPISDPTGLLGRETELAAICEALSRWEAGERFNVLLVGERGSGKTSLVDCAQKQFCRHLEVIRGELCQRLTLEPQIREFLHRVLGAGPAEESETLLASRRRVVILEGIERAFLRRVGYYGAIRAVQGLVAATGTTTLWVLTVDRPGFELLNAGFRFADNFSQRIDLPPCSPETLREAIKNRHARAGLQVAFTGTPKEKTFAGWPLRAGSREGDRESDFFKALARESGGILEPAFELWVGQVEGVEHNVVHVSQDGPVPDSSSLKALDLSDLFTLRAILQHGCLTPDEHATVFHTDISLSQAQIDRLCARGLVERDPKWPGVRVRPLLLGAVKSALYEHHLA